MVGRWLYAETKNQWARDDPCFVVLMCALVAVAALCYCLAFGHTVWHSLLTILSAVVIDFLALGAVLASAGWCVPWSPRRVARRAAPTRLGGRAASESARFETMHEAR